MHLISKKRELRVGNLLIYFLDKSKYFLTRVMNCRLQSYMEYIYITENIINWKQLHFPLLQKEEKNLQSSPEFSDSRDMKV